MNAERRDPAPTDLATEAVRLYERYAVEVVEAFQLCPWAKHARRAGRTKIAANTATAPDDDTLLAAIQEVSAEDQVDIGLVLWPAWRIDFDSFKARIKDLVRAFDEHQVSPITLAAFHPDAPADSSTAARLIPYLRRTPDPTIQVVKRAAIAAVTREPDKMISPEGQAAVLAGLPVRFRAGTSERVAAENLETFRGGGQAQLDEIVKDIRADRARTYAALEAR